MNIPQLTEDETEITLALFWQLLGELEGRTDPEKNVLDVYLVEGAYRHLNRIGATQNKPRWGYKVTDE